MSIIDWYTGKNVLISGGTGFMGKVLVEKILRSIPNIGKIYILCRSKRGVTPAQRVADFSKIPLFTKLLKENPNSLNKLIVVEGDITEDGLGIKEEIRNELIENINIVFHFAASLKLEARLKESVMFNLKGTLSMLKLATDIKHLDVFAHLSTAFCHCEEDILEEKLYSPPYNPHDILSVVNWMDDQMLEAVTPTLLDKHPNCYTFTKRLAEGLMHEYSSKIPIAVIRPSIVVPALKEPIPGWVDSLNGPIGVMVAAGKGVLRSMLCKPDNRAEVIPVDVAINCIIILTWARAQSKTKDVEVSNLSSGEILPVTWGEIVGIGREVIKEYPYDAGLWYPGGTMRTNPFTHAIVVFLCQILPAYFIDFIMLLTRNKRFMVRVQNRISLGMELLQYFTMRQWNFSTPKSKEIRSCLSDKESDIFYLPFDGIDIRRFLIDSIIGSRVFCLKEPLENLDRARKHLKWLYWLDKISQFCLLILLGWLLMKYAPIIQQILNAILPEFATNKLVHKT